MTRVVDTSVAVKWFVAEDGQQAAEKLIGQPLVAPELLLAEVCNVAWKKQRKGEIDPAQAAMAPQIVTSFVKILPSQGLAGRALDVAIELDHPVYDCFFLALCEAHSLVMVTADARLIRRCAGTPFEALLEPLL